MSKPEDQKQEVSILAMVDVPSDQPDRAGKVDALITYRYGPYQSGLVRVPKEGLDESKTKAAIKSDIAKKSKIVGMKFTL